MGYKRFNLLDEPWIRVLEFDGSCKELSLLGVFGCAKNYKDLGGELPTQDVAVLRLLLAILHTVVWRVDLAGTLSKTQTPAGALQRWQEIWEAGAFPIAAIHSYLRHYEDRFWLFHPKYPFFQIPGNDGKGTHYKASKLNGVLSQSNNKVRLFPHRSAGNQEHLSYAEAARWLLHLNAFDDTASKSTVRGLPSPGAGWLGQLGLVLAKGETLFETLLLNLVMLPDGENRLWDDPKPVWEKQNVKTDERTEISIPGNLPELYTLQSRRITLFSEGDRVVGYRLLGGDFFGKESAFQEQMTVWRKSKQSKRAKEEIYPRRHDPARQMWRDLAVLLGYADNSRRPGLIGWLRRLKTEHKISSSFIPIQVVGFEYADKDFFVKDIIEDSLTISSTLLTELGENWLQRIIAEVEMVDRLVWQVGILAQELALASGSAAGTHERQSTKEQGYYLLDQPFREWITRIDPIRDEHRKDETCEEWWQTAKKIIRQLGKELVGQASSTAFIGRSLELTKQSGLMQYTAPEAYNRFIYRTKTRETLFERRGNIGIPG